MSKVNGFNWGEGIPVTKPANTKMLSAEEVVDMVDGVLDLLRDVCNEIRWTKDDMARRLGNIEVRIMEYQSKILEMTK